MELQIPFVSLSATSFLDCTSELLPSQIFSHASRLATIPEEIKMKVAAYDKGIMTSWSPQQLILGHPATGWFVTHGGHNSVIESVSLGIPTCVYPCQTDPGSPS